MRITNHFLCFIAYMLLNFLPLTQYTKYTSQIVYFQIKGPFLDLTTFYNHSRCCTGYIKTINHRNTTLTLNPQLDKNHLTAQAIITPEWRMLCCTLRLNKLYNKLSSGAKSRTMARLSTSSALQSKWKKKRRKFQGYLSLFCYCRRL